MESEDIYTDEWHGLYGESWKGLICDEAFAHPAKFSRALIRKIYDHVIAEGWATKGSSVVDPFGGVALGGFDAMRHGLSWYGCELEQKFVGLGSQNIALWNERFSRMPNWGTARLIQGDSRKLAEVLSAAKCCVSSPPYGCDSLHRAVNAEREESLPAADRMGKSAWGGGYGNSDGQLSNLPATTEGHSIAISSPPYSESMNRAGGIDAEKSDHVGGPHSQMNRSDTRYGSAEGQLGAMKEGDHSIVITSPPFLEGRTSDRKQSSVVEDKRVGGAIQHRKTAYGDVDGQLGAMPEGDLCVTSPPYNPPMSQDHNGTRGGQRGTTPSEKGAFVKYGNTEGQLEGMPMEGFNSAISSPPYEATDTKPTLMGAGNPSRSSGDGAGRNKGDYHYGETDGQLGTVRGETFWSASRLILEQLHQVLAPNAHAVFVVKAFVRNKQIVDFPAQWAQLCEAVGFKLLHEHHALLMEEHGKQETLTGEGEKAQRTVARKSFFRRLAESKGSPRIDHESVLCFEKV